MSRARRVLVIASLVAISLSGCGARLNRVQAYNDFALDMAKRGLWEEATFRWEQALKRQPRSARILNNVGVAYEAKGRFDEALDAYRRAVALDSANVEFAQNLRRCERNQQRAAKIQGEFPTDEPLQEPDQPEPDSMDKHHP